MSSYKTYGEHDAITVEVKAKLAEATAGYPVGVSALAMIEMIMHHARQPEATPDYRARVADLFALASVEIQQGDPLHRDRMVLVT